MNALILAVDALRIANQNSGQVLFRWSYVSENGDDVRSTNGMWFAPDFSISDMPEADVYLLFEGNLPTQRNSATLLHQLRRAARFGSYVGGIDTGAFALAQAGIIANESHPDAVVHWEAAPAFVERFPSSRVLDQVFLMDGNTIHCAGGVATLDMMLELVGRFHGEELANEVANALVHTRRSNDEKQRGETMDTRTLGSLPDRVLRLMEENLDFPMNLNELSDRLNISTRKLARTCKAHFGESPMRLYLHVRLQAARNFLFYEDSSIKDVAVACGFSYPAVFSRAFKAQFGKTPQMFRSEIRRVQSQSLRPEMRRLISPGTAELHLNRVGKAEARRPRGARRPAAAP